MKVKSLSPLASLTNLTCLYLTAESEDRSLAPLQRLASLDDLDLNLLYPAAEYAKLAAFLPESICPVFAEPYETTDGLCKVNTGHTIVLPAGDAKRFCRDCNPGKLEEYMAEYQRIRDETAARGTWN